MVGDNEAKPANLKNPYRIYWKIAETKGTPIGHCATTVIPKLEQKTKSAWARSFSKNGKQTVRCTCKLGYVLRFF